MTILQTNNSLSRDAFEKWASTLGLDTDFSIDENGDYCREHWTPLWQAWRKGAEWREGIEQKASYASKGEV